MPALGTLAWMDATAGRLRWRDEVVWTVQAAQVSVGVALQQRWAGLGRSREGFRFDVEQMEVPASPAARAAWELCREVSDPNVLAHCERSYVWARVLAAKDGLRFDDEALYVACLLHDLGLTEKYADMASDRGCFTRLSTTPVREIGRAAGWSDERCDLVAEAITLHLNVKVRPRHGVEAALLRAGSALDAVGFRAHEVHDETLQAVVRRHPRLDLKQHVIPALRLRGDAPSTRARLMLTVGRFERRVHAAPFAD